MDTFDITASTDIKWTEDLGWSPILAIFFQLLKPSFTHAWTECTCCDVSWGKSFLEKASEHTEQMALLFWFNFSHGFSSAHFLKDLGTGGVGSIKI